MYKQKLYLCIDENNKLSVQTRADVDAMILNAEEHEGNMPYSVVGQINTEETKTPFLIIATNKNATIYEVVYAEDAQTASTKFLKKKRFAGKQIDVKVTRDVTPVVKEYFE